MPSSEKSSSTKNVVDKFEKPKLALFNMNANTVAPPAITLAKKAMANNLRDEDGESSEESIKISENDHQITCSVEIGEEKNRGARTTKDPNHNVNIKSQIKEMTMRGAQSALSNNKGEKSNLRLRKIMAK